MKFMVMVLALAVVLSGPQSPKLPNLYGHSRKARLFRHHSTIAWSCGSLGAEALVYKAGLAVDADGAFRAYHPNNRPGLDTIEHAGPPGHWWALATDTGEPSGRPVVQREGDPAPGYYVSMTSLFDGANPNERDPRRFVDAASIPYVVLPPAGFKHAKLGDFATVVNLQNGRMVAAIVADESAPELEMGEGSIALAVALAVDPNPRSGGIEHGVAYVVYPGSGNGKPRRADEITSISRQYFQTWGGMQELNGCLR